jgi:3-hydroxyacyl-CoA dehydrogenase
MSQQTTNPETEADAVLTEVSGRVLLVTIKHQPVNALSVAVRRGLLRSIDIAEKTLDVQAVLIKGDGRAFCGGADIREFGQPVSVWTREVCQRIENCSKLVIAAIHGVALGGGMEVALSAHYRIATASARLGLPEVSLGLLPGGGGTQRLPRLVGAKAALDVMLSARQLSAKEAKDLGIIDKIIEDGDLQAEAMEYVDHLISQSMPRRLTKDAAGLSDNARNAEEIAKARQDIARNTRGLIAPQKIIDAVEAASLLPFEQGVQKEKELFEACIDSPQRAGLVHAFFAEKDVLKVPEAGRAKPQSVERVGIVGGGTMGAGIAVAMLDAGYKVTMIERNDEALARGKGHVDSVYASLTKRGRIADSTVQERLSNFSGSVRYESLETVDLVVEAVFEDMEVKKSVFAELCRVCKPETILATNTSYLDVNVIAASTPRPSQVVGLHFFSPANIMKLAEVVVPQKASDQTVATAFDVAKKAKKIPVRAGVCDGFIGNRLLAAYRTAADYMMADGASPYQIDAAIREFGFPMGPYEVMDLAGGDIAWASRKRKAPTRDSRTRYVHIADRLCERGWFGQKTGRGFYLYSDGARTGKPDSEVTQIIDEERQKAGTVKRTFTDEEIVRRYLAAMINEGAKAVEEGIALRPLDVDVVLLNGYGFPRYRGGPMMYADQRGLDVILEDIRKFSIEDDFFWKPSALLERLVRDRANFSSLNK